MPFPKSKDPEGILERAALACPVKKSLALEVETPVVFHWPE